ncbi:MAG TPA: DUF4175 family protein, partial [Hyphomicrobiales bacterium]|nr:DUF4175 family protein [Hyphomicrobiales bacterium]
MNRKGKSEQARSAPLSPERRLLEKKVRAASRALLFEKLWPRIWLPLSVAGVFILLSALEVWQFLPPRAHLGLLWAFGIGFALSFVPLFAWRRPGREKSFQRLEQASGLDHRPVTAFNDTLPPESASLETRALWEAHRTRIALSLKKLRAGIPHARVDRYDPFALRAALVLMLTAVLFWAWPDLGSRLKAAFAVPEIPEGASFRIDAWISPPSYTRKEPFVLANGALSWGKESIAVPEGSILTVKINGSDAAGYRVSLSTDGNTERMQPVERSGDTYAEFTKRLEQSGTLSIGHGFSSGKSWALTIIADEAPSIAFTGPIEVSQRSVMLFKYKVDDDYGVASAEARVERVQPAPAKGEKSRDAPPQIGKPPVFPLTLPRVPVKSAESKTYKDLTAHPWAGLPVVITLVAKDEA